MKVYLLVYDASYDGQTENSVTVYGDYNKAIATMNKEVEQELMPSTWFGDMLEDEGDNLVQERTENSFEIYKDGEWLLYHARYEVIEKEVQ